MEIVILADVAIEHPAIMLCHIQGAMSHQLLESERIAATIQQILTGEGVTELVDGCTVDPSALLYRVIAWRKASSVSIPPYTSQKR